jgi:RNA-binding protein
MESSLKQTLKAKAHHLKPVILLGEPGLTASLHQEIDRAFYDHELIKIRVPVQDRNLRKSIIKEICDHHQAELIQHIGQIGIVYRKSDKNNQPS